MNRVLMLAYHFPPLGGAGVQRNIQLARHLGSAGYMPTVITGAGGRDDFRWTPHDSGLGHDVQTAVFRVLGDEPALATPRRRRWLRLRPAWEKWWTAAAVRLARSVGGEADLIHASVAPYMTADAALKAARGLRKPLVLDLEDPWALDDMLSYTTRLHRRLERRQMHRVLAAADAVILNTSEARVRVLEAFPDLDPARVAAVTNAFDPLDFAAPEVDRTDGRFRIVHTGSLHTDLGLRQERPSRLRRVVGGHVAGVDYLARSHVFLLEAVASVLDRRPELRGVVEVHLSGVFTPADREVAYRYPFVRLYEFLPHDETIALMRSADLLFLPLYGLPRGRRTAIVPHKTYEYIAAGRPILAAVPEGDARDLLRAAESAAVCDPRDVSAMIDILLADIERWTSGAPHRSPNPATVARCDAHRLVQEVAEIYDHVLGRRPRARRDVRAGVSLSIGRRP